MTAPNGPVVFNASTGSDTAASGLGPSTAVTGTGASLNATTTDYTIASEIENTMRGKIDDITLTADPFVDKANGDYNLNADAGGGAVLRSNNYTVGG